MFSLRHAIFISGLTSFLVLDSLTTFLAIEIGAEEMNPILDYLMAEIGVTTALTLVKTISTVLILMIYASIKRPAYQFFSAIGFWLYAWLIVANNTIQIFLELGLI